jgi:hypothetical protein
VSITWTLFGGTGRGPGFMTHPQGPGKIELNVDYRIIVNVHSAGTPIALVQSVQMLNQEHEFPLMLICEKHEGASPDVRYP